MHGVGGHAFDSGTNPNVDGSAADGVCDVGDSLETGGALTIGRGEGGRVWNVDRKRGHAEGDC